MKLKDSDNIEKFESGARRENKVGKGRSDLMPLDIIDRILNHAPVDKGSVLGYIEYFKNTKNTEFLECALVMFIDKTHFTREGAMISLSKHFEKGAEVHGEDNWSKGIPIKSYLSSGIRHYLNHREGFSNGQHHDRAFLWNIVCLIWTVENEDKLKEM